MILVCVTCGEQIQMCEIESDPRHYHHVGAWLGPAHFPRPA